jgi:hypothetical protein
MQIVTAALALFVLSASVFSADNPPAGGGRFKPFHTLHATQTTGKIILDGILSEDDWASAIPATDFSQRDPEEGKAASETTELRITYDSSAIYLGVRLLDIEPAKIVNRLSRRDDYADADTFTILLSPYHDGLTGALFQVSAGGVQRDAIISNDVFTDYSGRHLGIRGSY